jgi:hypothetical protein
MDALTASLLAEAGRILAELVVNGAAAITGARPKARQKILTLRREARASKTALEKPGCAARPFTVGSDEFIALARSLSNTASAERYKNSKTLRRGLVIKDGKKAKKIRSGPIRP